MKTLADLINAMDFRESLELAKEICDSRLAGILSSDREHVKQVVKIEAATADIQQSQPQQQTVQKVKMVTFYDSDKTQDILMQMGVKPSNKGFKYLMDSMEVLENDPTYLDKVTALYYKVAVMNDSTSSRVERAIRHALSSANGDMFYEVVPTCMDKCTNKEFITYLLIYLNKRQ